MALHQDIARRFCFQIVMEVFDLMDDRVVSSFETLEKSKATLPRPILRLPSTPRRPHSASALFDAEVERVVGDAELAELAED